MKSEILLIGENHLGEYNLKKTIEKNKFKPKLLLVEGPFEKEEKIENILLDFKINSKLEYPSKLFPLISEEDKQKYINDRNIPKNIEIKGLWNPNIKIFQESVNELCLEYYKLGNLDLEESFLGGSTSFNFLKIGELLKPIKPYLNKLKNLNLIKEEKDYLNWQIDQVNRILNEIDSNKEDNEKINELTFINSIRKLEQFEKQRETLTFRTNNHIFLNTINNNLQSRKIIVIVGSKHLFYLTKSLKRKGHNVEQLILG